MYAQSASLCPYGLFLKGRISLCNKVDMKQMRVTLVFFCINTGEENFAYPWSSSTV